MPPLSFLGCRIGVRHDDIKILVAGFPDQIRNRLVRHDGKTLVLMLVSPVAERKQFSRVLADLFQHDGEIFVT